MTVEMRIECLQSFQEFESVRDDWDAFMERCFPENYSRTHVWLSAWWSTYYFGKPALVYIQRHPADGRIVAAAPLLVRKENFGGFPVRMLQMVGKGLGNDDFLVGEEARDFTRMVFADLAVRGAWHVATFRRVSPEGLCKDISVTLRDFVSHSDPEETSDFYLEIPDSYVKYLKSRSSKFRNNLLQATKRLEQLGEISLEVLDPFVQTDRSWELCGNVAKESWQYKEGKSHFNEHDASSFYANLIAAGRGAGGEEFVVLMAGSKPVAFLLGCKRGRCYYLIDTAYHASFRNISVGRVLLNKTIELLIERGDVDQFNLEGGGEYKDNYATASRQVCFLAIFSHSLYARFVRILRKSVLYRLLKAHME